MSAHSRVFFPLRSNAKSLITGSPVNSVRRRIKLAALMHDEVYIEEGTWLANAGPRASQAFWFFPQESDETKWQTPYERSIARDSDFWMAIKPDSAPDDAPARQILRSKTNLSWRATFEPLKNELAPAFQWISFGHINDHPEDKRLASKWTFADNHDQRWTNQFRQTFEHKMISNSTSLDLLQGARLGAAISMDALHRSLVNARVQRGDATPIFGSHALRVRFPHVENLSWHEIHELRKHRDIRYFRDTIREIEASAIKQATSASGVDAAIHSVYTDALQKAQRRFERSFPNKLIVTVVGGVVGQIVTSLVGGPPFVGSVAGAVAGNAAEESFNYIYGQTFGPRWLTFDNHLRQFGR